MTTHNYDHIHDNALSLERSRAHWAARCCPYQCVCSDTSVTCRLHPLHVGYANVCPLHTLHLRTLCVTPPEHGVCNVYTGNVYRYIHSLGPGTDRALSLYWYVQTDPLCRTKYKHQIVCHAAHPHPSRPPLHSNGWKQPARTSTVLIGGRSSASGH